MMVGRWCGSFPFIPSFLFSVRGAIALVDTQIETVSFFLSWLYLYVLSNMEDGRIRTYLDRLRTEMSRVFHHHQNKLSDTRTVGKVNSLSGCLENTDSSALSQHQPNNVSLPPTRASLINFSRCAGLWSVWTTRVAGRYEASASTGRYPETK